jgi:hydrogenase maturation protease
VNPRILVAGIGNIFHGDDAFGVHVAQALSRSGTPEYVRVMDIGIRALDLAFALLDPYDLVILIDATQRGGAPGTLYTIQIASEDIPDIGYETLVVNSHNLDPVRVLALAKSMGAHLEKVFLVACEPDVLDRSDTGQIGLSEAVELSVIPAIDTIQRLFVNSGVYAPTSEGALS